VSYCSSCGEPGEGRFCRMCGTAYSAPAASAPRWQQSDATQVVAAFAATPAHESAHFQPDSSFDSLFRRPAGEPNPHSQTSLLPPVAADYRMAPPEPPHGPAAPSLYGTGYQTADQREEWAEKDTPRSRRPVILGTVAAVCAAGAVILGLLYVGSRNGSPSSAAPAGASLAASAPGQPSIGTVMLPPVASTAPASARPSASASSRASAKSTVDSGFPLSQGSTGTRVQWVQQRLQKLGYYHGSVNGQFDAATAQAVIAFQSSAQVTADPPGTVNRATYTALIAAGTKPDLKLNSKSVDVKRVQEALNAAENAGLTVNSKYDDNTMAAVWRYQSGVDVQPSGSMDGETWAKLQSGTVL
jgi:peptidoglycan hydrolase-like protein with peptidoglycan-binding domain